VDILELMEKSGITVRTAEGHRLPPSTAAAEFNASAYVQLIDSFVESKLYELPEPDSPLKAAYEEYDRRIIKRQLFRLLADFDVPADMDFSAYSPDSIIQHTLEMYRSLHTSGEMDDEVPLRPDEKPCGVQELDKKMFRCSVAEFHQGMKRKDPLMRVLFHSSKDPTQADFLKATEEGPPLTQKVFLFYDAGPEAHNSLLFRQLVFSFLHWARTKAEAEDKDEAMGKDARLQNSPRPQQKISQDSFASPLRTTKVVQQARIENSPGVKPKPRRTLSVRSSCPDLF